MERKKFEATTVLAELLSKHGIVLNEATKYFYDSFYIDRNTVIVESKEGIYAINNIDFRTREQLFINLDGTCVISFTLFGDI